MQMSNHLIKNNLVSQSLQGGFKARSSTMAIMNIYNKLLKLKDNDKDYALVTLDQSSAYDIVSLKILYNKLIHIGYHIATAQLIIDYLTGRQNYVEINTNKSTLIDNGDYGVNQGSVLSGFLYLCFTLDAPAVPHDNPHTSHIEDY